MSQFFPKAPYFAWLIFVVGLPLQLSHQDVLSQQAPQPSTPITCFVKVYCLSQVRRTCQGDYIYIIPRLKHNQIWYDPANR